MRMRAEGWGRRQKGMGHRNRRGATEKKGMSHRLAQKAQTREKVDGDGRWRVRRR